MITAGNAQTYKGGAQTSFLDRQCAILSSLDSFDAAPFTVQRLCELMLAVEKGGLVLHKFCTSVERLLSVTTTQSWRPWEGLREQREQRWRESKKRKVRHGSNVAWQARGERAWSCGSERGLFRELALASVALRFARPRFCGPPIRPPPLRSPSLHCPPSRAI